MRIYGGGGGVIIPSEIAELQAYGVTQDLLARGRPAPRAWPPMINTIVEACDVDPVAVPLAVRRRRAGRRPGRAGPGHHGARSWAGSTPALLERAAHGRRRPHRARARASRAPAAPGKSSLTDELVRRFRLDQEDKLRIAVLAVDPTRRRGGGALLGDRIRMNAIEPPQVLFRSLATRGSSEVPEALDDIVMACRAAGLRPRDRRDARASARATPGSSTTSTCRST